METDFERRFGILGDEDAGGGSRGVRFVEASLAGATGPHDWVIGAAFQRDRFRHRIPPHQGAALDFDHSVAGVFGQAQIRVSQKWTAAGSARVDRHNEFGTQVSPRISLLHLGDPWTVRISGGRGYLASTPLTPAVEELGMTGVVIVSALEPEVARGYAVDAGRTWGPVELQVAGFTYRVRNEAQLVRLSHGNAVRSQREPTRLRGAEGLVRYRAGEVTLTGSHLFVRTSRAAPAPPVPRHSAGLVAVWEDHDRGLLGLELYYHGRRPLADGGYRSESRPWLHVGVLGELRMGARSVFVNMENLLGVRQTRWDPLLRPIPDWFGRRTTEIWAPLDGFTVNAGVRIRFGGDHDDDHHQEQQ